jgi:predicted NAD/FAD-dependent oxidoreductase
MKIVIVGAGIGGPVTALRLHGEGGNSEIHEQSEQVRELGVGINVGGSRGCCSGRCATVSELPPSTPDTG